MRLKRAQDDANAPRSEAEITTRHPQSRDGVPVLVVAGEPVPVVDALEQGFEIVDASEVERTALAAGGYRFPDAPAAEPAA